jgi:hypothetical protein
VRVGPALLVEAAGRFEARVLEARLRAEGFDVVLRGPIDDPCVFTLGDHARVEVLVPPHQLADARLVLLADEVDLALAAVGTGAHDDLPWVATPHRRWAALACCGLLAAAPLARGAVALW